MNNPIYVKKVCTSDLSKYIVLGSVYKAIKHKFSAYTQKNNTISFVDKMFSNYMKNIDNLKKHFDNIIDADVTVRAYDSNIPNSNEILLKYEIDFFIPIKFFDINLIKLKNYYVYEEILIPYFKMDNFEFDGYINSIFIKYLDENNNA